MIVTLTKVTIGVENAEHLLIEQSEKFPE